MSMQFHLPPNTHTAAGQPRRVGVELELHGLTLERLAGVVADWSGGEIELVNDYEARVSGDTAGPWLVEFDFEYLKNKARGEDEQEDDSEQDEGVAKLIGETAERVLRVGAEQILPMEVISPPLPLERLGSVNELVAALREAGAMGTHGGAFYAFGTHLNPELPKLDAPTVTAYLKSFLCLYPWLRREAEVDLARRLSLFIEPFSEKYTQQVCRSTYQPGLDELIDDYLAHNPTRNRVLDMLPLFACLDEKRVRAAVDDPRIKPRPTLHYRMPNCEVDRPGWGLSAIWTDWLQVEYLACDPERLDRVCVAYRQHLEQFVDKFLNTWPQEVERWLIPADEL